MTARFFMGNKRVSKQRKKRKGNEKNGSFSGSRCRLPWTGVWLENGNELNITHNSIGNLGNCVQKSRDLYLLTSDT
ncbi:hypothetical protein CRE_01975 [Caenorhabditis remanei]|uniref:Uncharacterized protein n=1 Tax=Caenorhabditis remanei TaxID=31234 RepID=E3LGL0_CAERE|nr:hypothetical protein CRE_01975 [Caenorhabditis remanei]